MFCFSFLFTIDLISIFVLISHLTELLTGACGRCRLWITDSSLWACWGSFYKGNTGCMNSEAEIDKRRFTNKIFWKLKSFWSFEALPQTTQNVMWFEDLFIADSPFKERLGYQIAEGRACHLYRQSELQSYRAWICSWKPCEELSFLAKGRFPLNWLDSRPVELPVWNTFVGMCSFSQPGLSRPKALTQRSNESWFPF